MKCWIVLATLVGTLSMGCAHRQSSQGTASSPGGSQTGAGGTENQRYQPLNPSSNPPDSQVRPKAGPSPSDLAPEQNPGDSGPEFMLPRKDQETFSI